MVRLAARARRADRPDAQPRRAALRERRRRGRRGPAAAIGRALDAGVPWERLIVDPGFGFGKTPDHNLALLASLGAAARARDGRSCWGPRASRPSGGCWTCPPDQRVEATLATTVLGDRRRRRPRARPRRPRERAGGAHRRRRRPRLAAAGLGRGDGPVTDRIILDGMAFEGTHGVYPEEHVTPQRFEVDVELALEPPACRPVRRPRADARLRQGVRDLPPDRRVHPLRPDRGARRGDRARDPGRASRRRGHRARPQAARCGSAARSAAPASRSGGAGPASRRPR